MKIESVAYLAQISRPLALSADILHTLACWKCINIYVSLPPPRR